MGTNIRAERSDKKKRIYPYLKESTAHNLELIRQAINTQKNISVHDIAEDILDICSQESEIVTWIQNKYKVPGEHPLRVFVDHNNGTRKLKRMFEK